MESNYFSTEMLKVLADSAAQETGKKSARFEEEKSPGKRSSTRKKKEDINF